MTESKNRLFAIITILVALGAQVFTWFVLYPLAGYNDVTLAAAQSLFLALGIGLLCVSPLRWRQIGAGPKYLFHALLGITISYAIVLVILALLNAFGSPTPLFRQHYRLYALVNNWLLTGFGEELMFAGVLFNLTARSFRERRPWLALLLTAAAFALWHLPGYIAIGLRMDSLGPDLIFDLLLNLASWCFFGVIYIFGGNLWLTAFAHASTDYALLPAITRSPVFGLVFLLIVLAVAKWLGKRQPAALQMDADA